MGGLSPLFKLIRDRAPHLFRADSKTGTCEPVDRKDMVYIIDLLTRVHFLKGPSGTNEFTGEELFNFLFGPLVNHLLDGTFRKVIVCIDQPKYVPREKRATQEQRDKQARETVEPYNLDTERIRFTDEGIDRRKRKHVIAQVLRTLSSSSSSSSVSASSQVDESKLPKEPMRVITRFELERVLATRPLRGKLWRYLIRRLQNVLQHHQPPMPVNAEFIIDYQRKKLLHFRGNQPLSRKEADPCNRLGEGDMKAVYWASRHPEDCVVIYANDYDVPMIALEHLDHAYPTQASLEDAYPATFFGANSAQAQAQPHRAALLWQCPSWTCDLVKLCSYIRVDMHLDMRTLLATAILGGTDFVIKTDITHCIGHPFLLRAAQLFHHHFGPDWWDAAFGDRESFEQMLKQLYHWVMVHKDQPRAVKQQQKDDWNYMPMTEDAIARTQMKHLAEQLETDTSRSHRVPADTKTLDELFHFCSFNYAYWHSQITPPLLPSPSLPSSTSVSSSSSASSSSAVVLPPVPVPMDSIAIAADDDVMVIDLD